MDVHEQTRKDISLSRAEKEEGEKWVGQTRGVTALPTYLIQETLIDFFCVINS
jgi:hypothetical protein